MITTEDIFDEYNSSATDAARHIVGSNSTCGAFMVDPGFNIRSMMKPTIRSYTPSGSSSSVISCILVNASDTDRWPVKLGSSTMSYFPVVESRRLVPDWAKIRGEPLDAELLSSAKFDPKDMNNPVVWLCPLMAIFGYGHPYLDNKDLFDRGVQEQLGADYRPVYQSWSRTLALLLDKGYWRDCLDVYYAIKEAGSEAMLKYLGANHVHVTIHTSEPTIDMIPMSQTSHPRDFEVVCNATGPLKQDQVIQAPTLATTTIVSATDRREEAVLGLGQRVLRGISIKGRYERLTRTLVDIGFATESDAFDDILKLKVKDERVAGLKMLFDSNNSIRNDDNKYNQLVQCRDMADHDPLLVLSIITGAFLATPLTDLSKASSQLCAMQFLALGKEKIKALRAEIQKCRMQESVGEVDSNRAKKRVSFQTAELITELAQVTSLNANLFSAWQAMYR
ncbi:MAG: hypothetical protein ACPGSK_05100, partial [Alphaproteobacteria bacterium]